MLLDLSLFWTITVENYPENKKIDYLISRLNDVCTPETTDDEIFNFLCCLTNDSSLIDRVMLVWRSALEKREGGMEKVADIRSLLKKRLESIKEEGRCNLEKKLYGY
jgi:hypothetical protein